MAKAGDATAGCNPTATGEQPRRRHDWTALKTRYASGAETIDDLAEACGLNRAMVAKRASSDGWTAARDAFRAKAAAKVEAKALKARVSAEEAIDGPTRRAAKRIARAARGILTDTSKVTLDDAPKLKALVETLEKAYRLARVTAHLPAEPVVKADDDGGAADARAELLGRLARLAERGGASGVGGQPDADAAGGSAAPVGAVGPAESA